MNEPPAAVPFPCAFDKVLAQRRAACTRSLRRQVGEREVPCCTDIACANRCARLFADTLERGRFVHRGNPDPASMTHAQLLRFQFGTINGIRRVLGDATADGDIARLVETASGGDAGFGALPWDVIVQEIANCRMRAPRRNC